MHKEGLHAEIQRSREHIVHPDAGQDLRQRAFSEHPVRRNGPVAERRAAKRPRGQRLPEPVHPAGLRLPFRQHGPIRPVLPSPQARRRDRGAGVRAGNNLLQERRWYAVDLPDVLEYRETLLPKPQRQACLAGDAFSGDWIRRIRSGAPDAPVLVTAGGLFYYFEEEKVVALLRMLHGFESVEVVFDGVSRIGLGRMRKKYMKQMGHADARMFFCVDSAAELARRIGGDACAVSEEPYYRHIDKTGLKPSTKLSMGASDRLRMVKMVHVRANVGVAPAKG